MLSAHQICQHYPNQLMFELSLHFPSALTASYAAEAIYINKTQREPFDLKLCLDKLLGTL